jgi:predicted permease
MLNDLRHAVRVLLHAKSWTLIVVVSLALGIGANAALFRAVNGVLIRKIPVVDPDSLVRFRWIGKNDMVTASSDYGFSRPPRSVGAASSDSGVTRGAQRGSSVRATFSYPIFEQFKADNRTLSDLIAGAPLGRANIVVDGRADIGTLFIVSGNYYQVLDVHATLGRTVLPDDDRPDASPVAVLSDRYWRSRFGGDPNVVGKRIVVNNAPVTIVGVIESSFTGVQQVIGEPANVTVPLAVDPQVMSDTVVDGAPRARQATHWWLQVLGRLKPGVTPAQVQANLDGIFQATARAGFDTYKAAATQEERDSESIRSRSAVPHLLVESASHGLYDVSDTDERAMAVLGLVAATVLLIVCANVANLLLSRAVARHREISIRLSLGATRRRLIRQLLTESLILSVMGAAVGLVLAVWGQPLLPGSLGRPVPMDWRLLAFVVTTSVLTAIAFGILPALRATRDISASLKDNSRTATSTRSVLGRSLMIVQVALSLVLLFGAGLFLRTLQNLRAVDVGFDPQNLVVFRVSPQLNRYEQRRSFGFYRDLSDRLRSLPGIRAVTLSNVGLLSGSVNSTSIFVEGHQYAPDEDRGINQLIVAENFFDAMTIPFLRGRRFVAGDNVENAPQIAILNEVAVRRFFADDDPLGRRFGYNREHDRDFEVVGIVRDAKYNSLREPAPPTMYVPYGQARVPQTATFEVRSALPTAGVVNAIREAVRQLDPGLPVMDVSTQTEQIERRFAQEKSFAQAYAWFGSLAVLLASIGLFGLMSHSVSRRTNEIGIRMALGARAHDVLRLVLVESLLLVIAGIVVGIAIVLAGGRMVSNLVFGLAPTDVTTTGTAAIVLASVALVAGYLPARRASRVNPNVALRDE